MSNTPTNIIKFIELVINTKFEKKSMGYDPVAVDTTLDEIFEKFQEYIKASDNVNKKNIELQNENKQLLDLKKQLEEKNIVLRSELEKYEKSGYSMQIMNERLNKLENQDKPPQSKTKRT